MSRLILFSALVAISTGLPHSSERIAGGNEVLIEDYPYQVAVEIDEFPIASGVLLSGSYVLTTADAIVDQEYIDLSVRAGTPNKGYGGVVRKVENFVLHPEYVAGSMKYNFAILKLKEAFDINSGINSVPVAVSLPAAGTRCKLAGWGLQQEDSLEYSIKLRGVDLPIVEKEDCLKHYGDQIDESMVCAGEKGKDGCLGDQGSPLVCDGSVVGLLSFGFGCGSGRPSVYSSVSEVQSWINSNTQ